MRVDHQTNPLHVIDLNIIRTINTVDASLASRLLRDPMFRVRAWSRLRNIPDSKLNLAQLGPLLEADEVGDDTLSEDGSVDSVGSVGRESDTTVGSVGRAEDMESDTIVGSVERESDITGTVRIVDVVRVQPRRRPRRNAMVV